MLSRTSFRASRLLNRCYATSTTSSGGAPPMLLKIRKDLKTAMQAKDTTRLNVLRALLAQTLNASKTNSPIVTDVQVRALLKKNSAASRAAAEEFKAAGRQDLAEKEEGQVAIMEEYAGNVEMVGEEEVRRVAEGIIARMKSEGAEVRQGDVLKRVFAPEVLGEKNVDRGDVAKVVKEILAAK